MYITQKDIEVKDISSQKPKAYETFARDTFRRELASAKNETPYHVACSIQMAFQRKHGGKWVCILQTNSHFENCFWVEDDQDESYVEMKALIGGVTCAIWKVRVEEDDDEDMD